MNIKKLDFPTPTVSLTADSGYYLGRVGTPLHEVSDSTKATIPENQLDNWAEFPIAEVKTAKAEAKKEKEYKNKVESLIRAKYSQGDEDAIKRKMLATLVDANTLSEKQIESILDEFKEYNHFAEECKRKAKEE